MNLRSPKVHSASTRPTLHVPQQEQDQDIYSPRRDFTPRTAEMLSLDRIKSKMEGISFSRKLLSKIVKIVMEDVENQGLNGEQAKESTITILRMLICEIAPVEEKEWMLAAIDEDVIGEMIEIIIAATKGELEVNHGTKLAQKCVPCSFRVITKRFTRKTDKSKR